MKTKTIITLLAVILLAALAGVMMVNHQPPKVEMARQTPPPAPISTPAPIKAPAPPLPPLAEDSSASNPAPPAEIQPPAFQPQSQTPPPAVPQSTSAKKQKPPIQDPDARVALAYVGMDPDAEAYWETAINDLSLPPTERQDLIEDLNEDGLSDPKHPAPEDLPLIASRLQLIEELAPLAADEVNAKAFAEAHKDLVNLLNGKPAD